MSKKEEGITDGPIITDSVDIGDILQETLKDDLGGESLEDALFGNQQHIETDSSSTQSNKDEGEEVEEKPSDTLEEKDNSTTTNVDTSTQESSSSTSNALLLAKAFLGEEGSSEFNEEDFTKSIEENGEGEALRAFMRSEVDTGIKEGIEEYKSSLSPEKRQEIDSVEAGIDPNEMAQLQNQGNILTNLSKEDSLDEGTAKEVLAFYYKQTTGYSDKKIEREIKRLEDAEELETEAMETIPELIEHNKKQTQDLQVKAKEARDNAIKAEEQRIQGIKDIITSTDVILGKKINKQTQNKIKDMLLKPAKEINGRKVNAVWAKRNEMGDSKFDTILAGLILNGAFDGKLDISKSGKTKAVDDLTNALKTNRTVNSKDVNFMQESSGFFSELEKTFK